jgi:hypothetical protein
MIYDTILYMICDTVHDMTYDMIYMIYDKIYIYDTIYLLSTIEWTSDSSSKVHIYTKTIHNTTQSTQTIHRTTQLTN